MGKVGCDIWEKCVGWAKLKKTSYPEAAVAPGVAGLDAAVPRGADRGPTSIWSKGGVKRGVKRGVKKGLQKGVQKGVQRGVNRGVKGGVERGVERGVKRGGSTEGGGGKETDEHFFFWQEEWARKNKKQREEMAPCHVRGVRTCGVRKKEGGG